MAVDLPDLEAQFAASSVGIGVLDGIGDQFVEDQPDRRRLAGGDCDGLALAVQTDVLATAGAQNVRGEAVGEGAHVEPGHVVGLVEPAMDGGQRVDALQHGFQRLAELRIGDRAHLEPQQRADHGQVVLDPVVDLVEQQRLGFQRRLQVAGAGMDLRLDILLAAGQRLLGLDPIGHVELRGEEELDVAVLAAHRADIERIPEGAAVLAVIAQLDVHRLFARHGLAQTIHLGGIGVRPLQEPAVAADDLVTRVAGEILEGLVGEDDRIVGLPRIGDDHRHAGSANGSREGIAPALLVADDLGKVPVVALSHVLLPSVPVSPVGGEAQPEGG